MKGREPNSIPGGDPLRDPDLGARIPDELVDAFFDRELPLDQSSSLFSSLRNDPAKAREIVGTQRAIDALRQPPKSPDFSANILAEVGRRKGWLNGRERRKISFGRVATAAALLLMVGGAFVMQRVAPQFTEPGSRPAPIHDLTAAVPVETAGAGRTVATAFTDAIKVSLTHTSSQITVTAQPVAAVDACPDVSRAALAPAPPGTLAAFCRVVCTTAHSPGTGEPRTIVGRITSTSPATDFTATRSFVVPVVFPNGANQPLADDTLHLFPDR